ncbi:MAG: glycine cleavage system aminomethyltransferase GcvT [Candidatus Promineifilaceae bacterium]|jgi:glycine hydroxymethyltransferase
MSKDFIFRGSVSDLDPGIQELLDREDQRQDSTIILIASESMAPKAVQEAISSDFGNIYAEGYPDEASRQQTEQEILDMDFELARYRRYSDPRYYKGVEYADVLEALTRRRAAELFAANGVSPDNLYVNVQPLSGAPANSAVYTALLKPGETIMGLNLNDGGHLSHGSPVNRTGKIYNSVPYFVNPQTELLNYDAIEAQALEVKPQIIVAGYSAYPNIVDWQRFREIADKCGAYFLADIAHISGLVASGEHPSPIGIADVVSTTTHKSLCGPRGAMLMTHRRDLARKIDRAVFPGEQGGPHLNTMAALAVALKLAKTEQFHELQKRIVHNASRLAEQLEKRGLRIVGGGSQTHLLLVDTKSVTHNGVHLSGDMASRILDVAGIVANRNTIPGDVGAFSPTGVRMGTVWISQLGFGDEEIDLLAEAIATVLQGCTPYYYWSTGRKKQLRAKVDYQALLRGREIVRRLRGLQKEEPKATAVSVRGPEAVSFLDNALTSDVLALSDDEAQPTHLYGDGLDVDALLQRESAVQFFLHLQSKEEAAAVQEWLAALSNGYVLFDDMFGKLNGPLAVTLVEEGGGNVEASTAAFADSKPYFIGHDRREVTAEPLPAFTWEEPQDAPLKRTTLYETHKEMGGRIIPFGGYEMPVWYTSVSEEHAAVREAAGLFDATHMGVFEVSGPYALPFLDTVTTNDVSTLQVGESHYTYLLLPDGSVIDDLMVYRRAPQKYMLVVNASNNDKDWAWLNAVNKGEVLIDAQRPYAHIQHPATLRDLRDPAHGEECRVDVPLQGPASTKILLALSDEEMAARVKKLPWAGLTEGKVAGLDVIVSRTGYTGERIAYELFVHPQQAPELWSKLLEVGEPLGLKACGLAARDSTRTEAGLPLYGHELAGALNLNPGDAGFVGYVKLWKPFFVGRSAFIEHEGERDRMVTRFRMNEKGVRRPETGDPILDRRGKVVGLVTSCAIDQEGYLLGQAVLPQEMTEPGTPIYIYQLGGGQRDIRVPKGIDQGARLPMPDGATVLTRFPLRKKVDL